MEGSPHPKAGIQTSLEKVGGCSSLDGAELAGLPQACICPQSLAKQKIPSILDGLNITGREPWPKMTSRNAFGEQKWLETRPAVRGKNVQETAEAGQPETMF